MVWTHNIYNTAKAIKLNHEDVINPDKYPAYILEWFYNQQNSRASHNSRISCQTGSPIYAIHFQFQRWHHGSWIWELEWVRKKHSRSHKKQLERAKWSQFQSTGAWPCVGVVSTQIMTTSTQKQEKSDVCMHFETIWHISFPQDCRLWHQYVTVVHR